MQIEIMNGLSRITPDETVDGLSRIDSDELQGARGRARRAERRRIRREAKLVKIETKAGGRVKVAEAGGGIAGIVSGIGDAIRGVRGERAEFEPLAPLPPKKAGFLGDISPPVAIGGILLIGAGIFLATRQPKPQKSRKAA